MYNSSMDGAVQSSCDPGRGERSLFTLDVRLHLIPIQEKKKEEEAQTQAGQDGGKKNKQNVNYVTRRKIYDGSFKFKSVSIHIECKLTYSKKESIIFFLYFQHTSMLH